MVKFEVWTEPSILDFYKWGYSPKENYALAGMWPSVVVTDASGRRYHGIRGFDDLSQGMSRVYHFQDLTEKDLEKKTLTPDLYPELPVDYMEEYEYSESTGAVHLAGENVRLDIHDGGWDWYDAKDRWEIHTQRLLGETCNIFVPEQNGIEVPIFYRSQFGLASGKVNDVPVNGFIHFDIAYSHPGILYFHLPLIQKLEKQWSMWLVEYTDGDVDCGFAWKGRGNTEFRPGHLIRNGISTTVTDARTFTTYTERGTIWKTRVEIAGEWFELEQDTVANWPVHTFGQVLSTSRGKEISRSSTFFEWMPDNMEKLLAFYFEGKIQVSDNQNALIENECLVYPELNLP